ncbi:MAG TPA: hypothetical protein VFV40_00175 [Nocardioides sp.]|nr:hypothetical protein [Nocardioides sp.]
MIIRILNEGQWEVGEEKVDGLNELDAAVEAAVEAGDEDRFTPALHALLDAVRHDGVRLPDDTLHDSDLILPPADASLEEVRALLADTDEGLVPG